jgi:cytochrome b
MRRDEIQVWDPLVRIFHWGLVAAFTLAWLTQEEAYDLHLTAGYAVLGLVAFRILWGFVGTRHARFGDFVRGPSRVTAYLRDLRRGSAERFLGHNPAGGIMILLLLAVMLIIALSGVALEGAENRSGPLGDTRLFYYTDLIKELHEWSSNLALVLVLLHLAGVAHAGWAHGENLVRAMVTGRKSKDPGRD